MGLNLPKPPLALTLVFGKSFRIIYLAMGILQAWAITIGMMQWWDWEWYVAIVPAIIASYIPIVGPVLATLGAMQTNEVASLVASTGLATDVSWGWPWYVAVPVFFWLYLLVAILLVRPSLALKLRKLLNW